MTIDDLLDQARQLDQADPLSKYRHGFDGLSKDLIYLDGNSLGPLPTQTAKPVHENVNDNWGKGLIRSWNAGWYDLPTRLGDELAPLIGADAREVCFADSVTINLFKLAASALKHQGGRPTLLTDSLNFPSDYYALESLIGLLGNQHKLEKVASGDGMTVATQDLIRAINEDTAVITLSHVVFKSGFMHDLKSICKAARRNGALTLIDLSHSVGSVPINLEDWGVDMAVGCSYKYLNGGPGAPAFFYVREDLQDVLEPQLAGWFGTTDPFEFKPHHEPDSSIRKFMVGTPPILSMQAIERGIQLLKDAGIEQLREKSIRQSSLLLELFDTLLEPVGLKLGSPRDPSIRGSHLAFKHDEAFRINKSMISPPAGQPVIIPDFRTPDNLRIGIAPMFLGYEEIVRAAVRIHEIVANNEYKRFSHEAEAVT